MRKVLKIFGSIFAAAIILYAALVFLLWDERDICLDQGGCWNYSLSVCCEEADTACKCGP